MGVLDDKQDEKTVGASTATSSQKTTPTPTDMSQQVTGYARSLFEDTQAKWNDDRMGNTDQMETRYHDKDSVLKVANGLCYDIFFRADDIFRPDFDEIPEFYAPVLEEPKKEGALKGDKLITKPLDSKTRERTYILNPDEVEQEKKKPESRPSRGGSSRSSKRRRPRNNNRRRGAQGRSGGPAKK